MRRLVLAAVVALGLGLLASPDARGDSNADEAEARFQHGAALYRQGKYDEALLEFFASNRLAPNRNVRFNIARTYEALKQYDEAYRYYADYQAEETDAAERAATAQRLADLAPRVALVAVSSEPPGATVYIDRKDLGGRGETPLVLALPPGKHTVLVERAGSEPASVEVTLARGRQVEAALPLVAIIGTITVQSTPVGEVRLDRDEQDAAAPDAAATPATFRLAPGRHTVEVRAAGHRPRRRDVVVVAHADATVNVALEAIPPPAGTLVVQASVAGALVAVDGAAQGFTPAVMNLVVGRHQVSVTLDGFDPWERELEVTEGGRQFLEVTLRRKEAEVVGATRSAQAASEAPASVTLVSRAELEAFGYETLVEALSSVRGLYSSDDRNYRSLGIRGFSRPGDYTNRVLVLRDGHPVNDDWVGAAFVGRDFAPDLEDVQRIEVVRGPGSAFYGPGAFFGVVNVVSQEAGVGPQVHAGAGATSDGGTRAFARGATRLGKHARVSLEASAYDSPGQTFHFDEFDAAPSRGFVTGADGERAEHAALRVRAGDFALDASWNRRDKQVPTALYETVVDPANFAPTGNVVTGTLDARSFVEGRVERVMAGVRVRARLSWDRAEYDGRFPYDDPTDGAFLLRDSSRSQWFGGEAQVSFAAPGRQRLTVGVEGARHDVAQSVDEDADGTNDALDDTRTFVTAAVYAVDELALTRRLHLTGGARLDQSGGEGLVSLSPRLAAVIGAYEGGVTKLIVGRAFRAPSTYELYYQDGGVTQLPAGTLDAETVWTAEVEHTHRLGDRSYVTGGVFGNRIDDLIGLAEEPTPMDPADPKLVFQNSAASVTSLGGELEARRTFASGAWVMGAVSYARLTSDDTSVKWNSAPVTAVLRGYWPASGEALGLAAELIYNAPRPARDDATSSEHVVLANLIASGRVGADKVRFRVAVMNLLDWTWSVPVGDEYVPLTIRQNGRTFLVQLAYEY